MAKLRESSDSSKYTANVLQVLSNSMTKKMPISSGDKKFVVANTSANKNQIKTYVRLMESKDRVKMKQALDLLFETTEKKLFPIGSIDKPKGADGKPKGNRGDVGEGIFAAAIVARFIRKNRSIDVDDVRYVLQKLGKPNATTKDIKLPSVNMNPHIIDEVHFHLSLAKPNMEALLATNASSTFKDVFHSAVLYANGPTVIAWSKLLYENNQKNSILISSAGTEDQTGTKVDVRVYVDDHPTDINVSLKVGDVKQFGQIGGADFSKMKQLFEPLGVIVADLEKQYTELLAKKKVERALYLIYERARNQINRQLTNTKTRKAWLKKLAAFIQFHATRNEKEVTLVQLNRGEAHVYAFDSLQNAIAQMFIKVRISDVAGKPKLIFEGEHKVLLEIRAKAELSSTGNAYIRHYLEKGALLGEMIGFHLSGK